MNFFTHITLSRILYNQLKDKFEINRRAFIYGNIKPDLMTKTKSACPHMLNDSFLGVCKSAKDLMDRESLSRDDSIELGIICHHICDFFCLYHVNEEKYNCLVAHHIYEFRLHFELLKMLILKRYKPQNGVKEARKNIASIITEMRKDYFSKPHSMEKDIRYALSATMWVCESLSCHCFPVFESINNNNTITQTVLSATGGK